MIVVLGRPGAGVAGAARGAGARRRSRAARRRATRWPAPMPSPSPTRWRAALAGRASSTSCSPACSPTIRASPRSASCSPSASAWRTRRSSCRSRSPGRQLRVKRELEGGWFQWLAMPLPARADHPERHQPAALRHAQGHHGGEEEGDPRGRRAAARDAALQIVSLYAPEKSKQTRMHRRQRRPTPRASWCASCATTRGVLIDVVARRFSRSRVA